MMNISWDIFSKILFFGFLGNNNALVSFLLYYYYFVVKTFPCFGLSVSGVLWTSFASSGIFFFSAASKSVPHV